MTIYLAAFLLTFMTGQCLQKQDFEKNLKRHYAEHHKSIKGEIPSDCVCQNGLGKL